MFKQAEMPSGIPFPRKKLYTFMSTACNQTFLNNTYNTVTGWNNPDDDINFNGTEWTCPEDGRYEFIFQITTNAQTSDYSDHYQLRVQHATVGGGYIDFAMKRDNLHYASYPSIGISKTKDLKKGEKIRVLFYHDRRNSSGTETGNLNAFNNLGVTFWQITEIPKTKPSDSESGVAYRKARKKITTSNSNIGDVSEFPDTIVNFHRIGKQVTVDFGNSFVVFRETASSNITIIDGFIPEGFRPISTTTVVYGFSFADRADYMLVLYNSGKMVLYYRDVVGGGAKNTTTFSTTSHTYITNDE